MSNQKRKIVRAMVNGARKEIKKKTKEIIKFNLGEDRDKEIERRKAHAIAKRIYENWSDKFVNTRKTPEEVTNSLNELAAQLDNEIVDKEFVDYILKEIIFPSIQKSHELSELVKNAVVFVQGRCGCGATCEASVPQKAWLLKAFDVTCNDCFSLVSARKCHTIEALSAPKNRRRKK